MKKLGQEPGAYVQRVREGTQRYTQDLLSDNERLRVLVATLEAERTRLQDRARANEDLLRELDVLRGLAASLEREKVRIQEQLLAAHQELDGHRRERELLQHQLAEIERQSRSHSERYVQVEAQNSNLANLYVASYRLQGTLNRREVLEAIEEIVGNLIGCEELAIYEMDARGEALELVSSVGLDHAEHARVPLGVGRLGRAAVTGEPDVASGQDSERAAEARLSACIPLKLDGRVTGALALFRLLPQKPSFEAVDHELFELLATHAATALYCTALQARLSAQPA